MLARISSGAVRGVTGYEVALEVQIGFGLVSWNMVGLPDGAVRESKIRVKSALEECGYDWPPRPIAVNLAPAGVRKDGTAFDLPMALALLAADKRIPTDDAGRVLCGAMVIGELGFSGDVRPIRGALPLAVAARDAGFERIIVPIDNAAEASLVDGLDVLAVSHLNDVLSHARGETLLTPFASPSPTSQGLGSAVDFSDVKGQPHAIRAMEVAAAGGHNLLMIGPPGSGKTMLARRMPTILPRLSFQEALEVTTLYSIAGLLPKSGLVNQRPFRTPHHTISDAGLIGGGAHVPRPGEVSLAHHGVLFLDEMPEFRKHALEVLRQPLEDQRVTLTRSQATVEYPAQVMLVAAMNGCPCGFSGSRRRACRCRPDETARYRGRLSGPLLDRIDLHVEVQDVSYDALRETTHNASSAVIRERVERARERQLARFTERGLFCNAQMRPAELRRFCEVDAGGHRLLERVVDRLGMSARAHDRILKVARTIADLDDRPEVLVDHLAEAIAYRTLDRGEASAFSRAS